MDPKKILIVDDDPDITEAMSVVLETKNYAVTTASNSADAADAIAQSTPDLVILDVMMDSPREGFVFSRKLKDNPDTKDIPVLMITSVKDKVGIDFKSEAGDDSWLPVQDFLDKPVQPDVLLAKVAELLK
jgi:CheY-like chemotaxis protein